MSMTDEQLNQYESDAHKQVVEDDWVVVEWVYDLIKEVRGYKTEVERLKEIDETESLITIKIRNENRLLKAKVEEMQKIIDTAVMFLQSNELNIKAEQIKAMYQSLKGDKP